MNTIKNREPFNTVINITTTASQKRTLEEHAKQFNTSVSEVLREIIDIYRNDSLAIVIKDFANKTYDDNVTLSYNLSRAIMAVLKGGNIANIDKDLVDQLQELVDLLQEKIAVGVGKKVKELDKIFLIKPKNYER